MLYPWNLFFEIFQISGVADFMGRLYHDVTSHGVTNPCFRCAPGLCEIFKYEVYSPFVIIIPLLLLLLPSLLSPLPSFSHDLHHCLLVVEHVLGGSPAVVRLLVDFFHLDGLGLVTAIISFLALFVDFVLPFDLDHDDGLKLSVHNGYYSCPQRRLWLANISLDEGSPSKLVSLIFYAAARQSRRSKVALLLDDGLISAYPDVPITLTFVPLSGVSERLPSLLTTVFYSSLFYCFWWVLMETHSRRIFAVPRGSAKASTCEPSLHDPLHSTGDTALHAMVDSRDWAECIVRRVDSSSQKAEMRTEATLKVGARGGINTAESMCGTRRGTRRGWRDGRSRGGRSCGCDGGQQREVEGLWGTATFLHEGWSTRFWREFIGTSHFSLEGRSMGFWRGLIGMAVFTEGVSDCGRGLDEGESESDKGKDRQGARQTATPDQVVLHAVLERIFTPFGERPGHRSLELPSPPFTQHCHDQSTTRGILLRTWVTRPVVATRQLYIPWKICYHGRGVRFFLFYFLSTTTITTSNGHRTLTGIVPRGVD
ncbi:hypothetical protein ARMGADRAFT_1083523 [Armillaria gallica]|uniref:Uncharacterized protein n=1 Tax=Armillaria gallica TaxID=47427 RepID=A0A2H3DKD6_ARMGA|nr:hypothetical protein ARMGADRAFT_1083523 [Armillaria gallica]